MTSQPREEPSRWYVRAKGEVRGPFQSAEIRRMVSAGELQPDDEVRRDGAERWSRASTIKGLFDAPSAAAAALPDADESPEARRFDVFVSYSHKDKHAAEAVVHHLESEGIRCWIAPRDIVAGTNWSGSIMRGLEACRVMVLIFSSRSNSSQQVLQEVERAVNRGLAILPLRIEDVPIVPELELFIATRHWLDALHPPIEQHLEHLTRSIKSLLDTPGAPPLRRPSSGAKPPAPAKRHSAKSLAWVAGALLLAAGAFLARDWLRADDIDVQRPDDARGTRAEAPAADDAAALAATKASETTNAARDELLAAVAPGRLWRVIAKNPSGAAKSLELRFLDRSRDGTEVSARIEVPGRDDVCVVYTGRLRQVNAGAGSAATWQLSLRPVPTANLADDGVRNPLGNGEFVLSGGHDALAGSAGDLDLSLDPRESDGSDPLALADRAASAAVVGSTWTGRMRGAGGSFSVQATWVRNDGDGEHMRLSLAVEDDPWHPALFVGAFAASPHEAYGWPGTLERSTSPHPPALLDATGATPLRMRALSATRLVGVVGEWTLDIKRIDDGAAGDEPPLESRLHPIKLYVGRALGESAGRKARWTFVSNRDGGRYLRATLEDVEDPGTFFVLEGELLDRERADFEAWPLRFKREARRGPRADATSRLLGEAEVEMLARVLPDGRLIGWCGDERFEFTESDQPTSLLEEESQITVGAELLAACGSDVRWEGSLRRTNAPEIAVALRFVERADDGARVVALAESSALAGKTARLTGRVAHDRASVDGWAFRLRRTEPVAGENGQLFGEGPADCLLRLDAEGRLIGSVGQDEWLELRRVAPTTSPETTATAASITPAVKEPANHEPPSTFWDLLTTADARISERNFAAARDSLKKADALLAKGSEQAVLVDLREAECVYLDARSGTDKKIANSKYAEAIRQFERIGNRKTDVVDHKQVSARATAAYWVCYLNAVLWYTTEGRQLYQEATNSALDRLTRNFPEQRDATGRLWVERAKADLAELERRARVKK